LTELAAAVQAVLERSVLPSVIARGGALRIAAAGDGTVTLELTGSPGAVFPLASRIEELIRAAVPQVTAVRLVTPGQAGTPSGGAGLAEAARRVLDAEGAGQGWVRIRLEGGCQGCSLAEVTVRQGIEPLLRARLPAMTGLADVTDHEAGTEPFFSPQKR
jgi:Fe-S cluster biogenesis protein NfuA